MVLLLGVKQADKSRSVAFYGDLILSRACHEERIVLWRIEGFDSDDPPLPPDSAPTAHDQSRTTRSAFAPASAPSQWMRLLQFETMGCGPQFFLRFSLHHAPGQHPMLCFCNAQRTILMWDMTRLTAYQEFINSLCDPDRDPDARVVKPAWLMPAHHKTKVTGASHDTNFEDVAADLMRPVGHKDPFGVGKILEKAGFSSQTIALWQSRFDTSNPHKMIKPHKSEVLQGQSFVGRQVAWSADGSWCVVVGSRNHAAIFQRWAKGGRHSSSRQNSHVPSEALSRQGTAAARGGSEATSANASFLI